MTNAVVIGQSHTACMANAISTHPDKAWDISVTRLRSGDKLNDPEALSIDDAMGLVSALEFSVPIFISIVGTYHNILGLIRFGEDFDFLMDGQSTISDESCLVPNKVLTSAFDENLKTEKDIQKLKAVSRGPVYLLACPPPKQDSEFMLQKLTARRNKPYRGRDVATHGINRPELRRKLWLLECQRLELWAQGLEIGYLPPPIEAFDQDGFLAKQFYADDATHANAEYGALVLSLIASTIESRERPR